MSLYATTPFAAHFRPNWRNLPPPPAPTSKPFEPRRPRDRREGDGNGAMFGAWGVYCYTHGRPASGKDADERMRRGIAVWLPEFTGRRRDLTNNQCFTIARRLDHLTQQRDGGFHARLFGHCQAFQADRRLLPAAFGLLLGGQGLADLYGANLVEWRTLCRLLIEHTESCDGGEACTLRKQAITRLASLDATDPEAGRRAA